MSKARQDFLNYAASYSGVDGGDLNAEYWFVGIEWSDVKDIKNHYQNGVWQEVFSIPESPDITQNPENWKLENAFNKLYAQLPHAVAGKNVFQQGSNSLKLNLFPLPFENTSQAHDDWTSAHPYTQMTGLSSFDEYEHEILPQRKKLFQRLLKQSSSVQKTVFCFGKKYKDDFLKMLQEENVLAPKVYELPECKFMENPLTVRVFTLNDNLVKQIFICPFPYSYRYEFSDKDWAFIAQLVAKA